MIQSGAETNSDNISELVDDKYLGSGDDDLLIVRGFPKSCKVEEVEEFLKDHGVLAGFRMPVQYKLKQSGRVPTGKNRGYCFVKFKHKTDEVAFREIADLSFQGKALSTILADRTEQVVKIE